MIINNILLLYTHTNVFTEINRVFYKFTTNTYTVTYKYVHTYTYNNVSWWENNAKALRGGYV